MSLYLHFCSGDTLIVHHPSGDRASIRPEDVSRDPHQIAVLYSEGGRKVGTYHRNSRRGTGGVHLVLDFDASWRVLLEKFPKNLVTGETCKPGRGLRGFLQE